MECCTLRFLGIVCLKSINQKFGAVARYFLIQVLASSLLLVSLLFISDREWSFNINIFFFNLSLMIKIGLFPFHFWVIRLIPYIRWVGIYLLSSVQKIIPILILRWSLYLDYLVIVSVITILISIYKRIGLTSIKIIFRYSILSHTAWICIVLINLDWWLFYFIFYSFIFLMVCLFHRHIIIDDFRDLTIIKLISPKLFYIYVITIISFIGIPPLLGFTIKWIIMIRIVNLYSYFVMLFVVGCSVVHLFYYIKILLWSLIFFSSKRLPIKNCYWVKFNKSKEDFMFKIILLMNLLFYFICFYLF